MKTRDNHDSPMHQAATIRDSNAVRRALSECEVGARRERKGKIERAEIDCSCAPQHFGVVQRHKSVGRIIIANCLSDRAGALAAKTVAPNGKG